MNAMKKLTIIVALLFVSMAFVGAASAAATADYTSVSITPSGSLIPEQVVTANFKINLPGGSITDSDYINFGSDLVNAKWNIQVVKGGTNAAPTSGSSTPNAPFRASTFTFYYGDDTDVTLVVSLTGKVADTSAGKAISILKITSTNTNVKSYTSTAQNVYNPSNLNSDLTRLNKDISDTETRIAAYSALGVDVSSATQQIANAKNKASAAQSAGSGNPTTAYANIEAADAFITQTERSLALAGLKAANTNMGLITTAQNTLYERGWNTEAQYLETKLTSMKYTYDSIAAQYNSGGNPDTAKLDQLVKDSYTILEQANQYVEDSEGLPIMNFLPIIIGVIVAIAAVVGVVFLLRKRNNRWDELG